MAGIVDMVHERGGEGKGAVAAWEEIFVSLSASAQAVRQQQRLAQFLMRQQLEGLRAGETAALRIKKRKVPRPVVAGCKGNFTALAFFRREFGGPTSRSFAGTRMNIVAQTSGRG